MVAKRHFRNDLRGQRFGRLTVEEYVQHPKIPRKGIWKCICDCGRSKLVRGAELKNGRIQSCGCLRSDLPRRRWENYREPAFWARVEKKSDNECWPWTGSRNYRPDNKQMTYGWLRWKGQMSRAHRVAWQLANSSVIPIGMQILHTCDNPVCCNPAHLRIGTHVENMADMKVKGRAVALRGADSPRAKFTEEEVREIRKRYKTRWPYLGVGQLAKEYGVHRTTMSSLIRGKSYK